MFKIQSSKVWIRLCKLCEWTQKLQDKIVSNKKKKTLTRAKNILKPYALNIAYWLWILYDLGSAEWLRDTIQSLNPSIEILAGRWREDSCDSWLRIETVQTSKWLKWKAKHFVAHRKLTNDTSATINGLPEVFLSLVVERKIIDDVDWINL